MASWTSWPLRPAAAADADGDGVPDACSICPGDFDGDGAVTFPDLVRVLSAWGAAACPEDLDGNGVVGFPDLVLILSVWGGCYITPVETPRGEFA